MRKLKKAGVLSDRTKFSCLLQASEFEVNSEFSACSAEEHHDAWLSGEAGKEILVPYPADRMKAWPASPRMNSPKNNDPEIIVPIEPESVALSENLPQLL